MLVLGVWGSQVSACRLMVRGGDVLAVFDLADKVLFHLVGFGELSRGLAEIVEVGVRYLSNVYFTVGPTIFELVLCLEDLLRTIVGVV